MEHRAILFSHSGDSSGVQLGFFKCFIRNISDMISYPLFLQNHI